MSTIRKVTVSLALAGALSAASITPALAATGTAGRPSTSASTSSPAALHPNVDPGTVVGVIQKIYGIYKSFAGGGSSAQLATQQIIDAINSAKVQIMDQIDAVATSDVQACVKSAIVDFNDFDRLSFDNQQALALSATNCATRADTLLSAVSSQASKDQLGFAVNTVGPIALMARVRVGLTDAGLTPVLHDANQVVYNQLIPSCERTGDPETHFRFWHCDAYNGDSGEGLGLNQVRDSAGARTSWLVAERVLPMLA